ncbi:MAG: hypothetical protein LQ345_005241 [Seirophora villosa]|nr:MAG: hypothetical protein LQ345_005241 [Seirophora villosa]
MAFAPPAVRDSFSYNGELYVDVGNLNRHKRASVAELTQILRPDLNKSKKNAPVKDPVGHWYEAQLIHYGLPPSKDKARAKMRLLENLNNANLNVPPSIISLESDLKKEFAAAERKIKAQHKAAIALTQSTSAKEAQSKKRKESDVNVTVNLNFGPRASPSEDTTAPAKKRKLQTAPRGKNNPLSTAVRTLATETPVDDASIGSSIKRTKQTARRGGSKAVPPAEFSHAAFHRSGTDSGAIAAPSTGSAKERPKQTARRSASSSLSYRPLVLSSHSDFESTTVKKEPAIKKEPAVKKEPGVKKEPKVKMEPASKKSNRTTPAVPSLGLINGIYDITCPAMEREWDYEGFNLILTLESPSVWGQYDLGMFSGLLLIPERPYSASNQELPFSWRGRENGEGEMNFGDDCRGGITFLGDGRIEGWINVYGDCPFEGQRRLGPGAPVRSARSMYDEWDMYNSDEYERERVGRWH